MIYHLRRPTEQWLQDLVGQESSHELTYHDHGATLGSPPERLHGGAAHHLSRRRRAGAGVDDMRLGRDAIRSWAGHRAMGMALEPPLPPLTEGATMAFAVKPLPLPLWVSGACRVVAVVDEDRRFGFVYGTLPHHPESGEEAFLVHHHPDDTVEFEIAAFSRSNDPLVRFAGPVGRWMQHRSVGIYLEGFARSVARRRGS